MSGGRRVLVVLAFWALLGAGVLERLAGSGPDRLDLRPVNIAVLPSEPPPRDRMLVVKDLPIASVPAPGQPSQPAPYDRSVPPGPLGELILSARRAQSMDLVGAFAGGR